MTSCPSQETLRLILADAGDDPPDDELIEHVGQCERCQCLLDAIACEEDRDDASEWTSILKSDRLIWPTVAIARDAIEDTGHDEVIENQPDPLARTLPYIDSGSDTKDEREPTADGQAEFADYQILRKLGVGGMGIVFLARQKSANRLVALKIVRPEQLESLSVEKRMTWLNRFRSEARLAARLEHDGVVRVYEVGEYRGTLYYSMQYIEGETLSALIRRDPIENRRVARLMHAVALAVDHAHHQGILHRDLKPHNILVQSIPSEQPTGSTLNMSVDITKESSEFQERAFVADFGLAKNFLDGRDGSTLTGEAIGSPSYMPPEQAQDASRCTPLSDVYGLGATLYDALTGRPPFRAASPVETLRQVIFQQPVPPRELNPAIDLDLQTITLKSLEKEPSRRYASARLFAEDLSRYLRGVPISARPIGHAERFTRWCRRNPIIATLAGGVVGLLMVVAIVSATSSIRLRRYANRESIARKEAEQHFAMSLSVIHEMLTEFGDESLAHVPQMEQARKDLLQKALSLYSDLSASKPTSPELRVEYARTKYRIGNLYDLLGEHGHACDAYAEAIVMFDELGKESPENLELKYGWANGHSMLGETLRKISPNEARSHLQQAIEMHRHLHQRDPMRPEYGKELSRALNNQGLLATETGDYELAQRCLQEAIGHLGELTQRSSAADDELAEYYAYQGRSQINLGVLLRKLDGREGESEQAYRDAIENLQKAYGLDPKHREYRFMMAVATIDLANYFLTEVSGGAAQALELANKAREVFAILSDEFPSIPVYQYEYANACNTEAVALATNGNVDAAQQQLEEADDTLEVLQRDVPDFAQTDARFPSLRGRVFGGLGFVHSAAGRLIEAQTLVGKAIDQQTLAVGLQPENPDFSRYLDQHRHFSQQLQAQLENAPNEPSIEDSTPLE